MLQNVHFYPTVNIIYYFLTISLACWCWSLLLFNNTTTIVARFCLTILHLLQQSIKRISFSLLVIVLVPTYIYSYHIARCSELKLKLIQYSAPFSLNSKWYESMIIYIPIQVYYNLLYEYCTLRYSSTTYVILFLYLKYNH